MLEIEVERIIMMLEHEIDDEACRVKVSQALGTFIDTMKDLNSDYSDVALDGESLLEVMVSMMRWDD